MKNTILIFGLLLALALPAAGQLTNGVKISGLPVAGTLDGSEIVPILQSGTNKQAYVNMIQAIPLTAATVGSNYLSGRIDTKVETNNATIYNPHLRGTVDCDFDTTLGASLWQITPDGAAIFNSISADGSALTGVNAAFIHQNSVNLDTVPAGFGTSPKFVSSGAFEVPVLVLNLTNLGYAYIGSTNIGELVIYTNANVAKDLRVGNSLTVPSITLNGDTRTSWPTGTGGSATNVYFMDGTNVYYDTVGGSNRFNAYGFADTNLSNVGTVTALTVTTINASTVTGNGGALTNLASTNINLAPIFYRGTNAVSGMLIPRCAVSNGVIYPYGTASCTNLFESLSYTNGL